MTASTDPLALPPDELRRHLLAGQVIPAHPLALSERRTLDEPSQRALTRYYLAAGAGGLAVGVHTTQFAIRTHGLYEPVLRLAIETAREALVDAPRPVAMIAGIAGDTRHAVREATIARDLGYHAGLLSLAALREAPDEALMAHARAIGEVIPLFGFYLQPAVGGRVLSYDFWRAFAGLEAAVAIKIAPFDRYRTLDVMRAVADSGRRDLALYTGNDDNIVADLLTRWPTGDGEALVMHGGLLGHWAVWTRTAVRLLQECQSARSSGTIPAALLETAAAVTEMNAALFDVAHGYRGCIAGIHEVLRRQGLMRGTWCLDPDECLSPGQADELTRVMERYPGLTE